MAGADAFEHVSMKDCKVASDGTGRTLSEAASYDLVGSALAAAGVPSLSTEGIQQVPSAGSVAAAVLLASKSNAERQCAVCGDVAVAINFGVITCDSCKAFFRRNAAREEQLKCVFSGECCMSVNSRRFCPACRLKSCLSVGMNKELILGEDELRRRREVTAQHRQARLLRQQRLQQQQQQCTPEVSSCVPPDGKLLSTTTADWCGGPSGSESGRTSADKAPDEDVTDLMWQNLGSLAAGWCPEAESVEMAAAGGVAELAVAAEGDEASRQWQQPQSSCGPQRQQQLLQDSRGMAGNRPCQDGVAGSEPPAEIVLAPASAARPVFGDTLKPGGTVEPVFSMGHFDAANASSYVSPSSLARRSLNTRDEVTMALLQQAYCTTIGMVIECEPESTLATSDLESAINRTSIIVQRLIGFARCIPEFTGLPMLVQMALLKQATLPCITLRSAQLFDSSSSWSYGDGCTQVSLDLIAGLVSPSCSNEYRVLVHSIKRLVPTDAATGQCDLSVFALLLVIVLLSPEYVLSVAEGVQQVAAQLSDGQQHYIMLLSRYLQMRRSFAHAAVLLPALLNRITMCKQVALSTARAVSCCDRTRIDPLLQEVYELDRAVAAADC